MTIEPLINIATAAGQLLFWWTCIGALSLPFVLALLKANGPDRERTRIRIIAVDGEIVRRG